MNPASLLSVLPQVLSQEMAGLVPASLQGLSSSLSDQTLRGSVLDWSRIVESRWESRWPTGAAALLGDAPVLAMDAGDAAWLVLGTGAAALLIRGIQKFWEAKNRPFGSIEDANRLVLNWAVTNEGEARAMAAAIGAAFLKKAKTVVQDYYEADFRVPYTISPSDWHLSSEKRHALTAAYLKRILPLLRDFSAGLGRMSERDFGDVYEEVFGDFSRRLFLVAAPMTRWENPPNREDEANFEAFQKVLRRELKALEEAI